MRRRKGDIVDGVLLLDKPEGLSSNVALQKAKRLLNAQKAGHTGTLDPFATGLLICCMGKATKICNQMLNADKRYTATVQLGQETDSGDLTGQITQQSTHRVTATEVAQALQHFTGTIEQIPPMYSALKKDGQRLYELARQGIEVERPARTVHIYELHCCTFDEDRQQLVIDVLCSKGTYIRTLAQDIGRYLQTFAHLTALRRTQIGDFSLDHAVDLIRLENSTDRFSHLIRIEQLPDGLMPSKKEPK